MSLYYDPLYPRGYKDAIECLKENHDNPRPMRIQSQGIETILIPYWGKGIRGCVGWESCDCIPSSLIRRLINRQEAHEEVKDFVQEKNLKDIRRFEMPLFNIPAKGPMEPSNTLRTSGDNPDVEREKYIKYYNEGAVPILELICDLCKASTAWSESCTSKCAEKVQDRVYELRELAVKVKLYEHRAFNIMEEFTEHAVAEKRAEIAERSKTFKPKDTNPKPVKVRATATIDPEKLIIQIMASTGLDHDGAVKMIESRKKA